MYLTAEQKIILEVDNYSNITAINKRLNLTLSTTSDRLIKLNKVGLIDYYINSSRREKIVVLTERGKIVKSNLERAVRAYNMKKLVEV